MNIVSKLLATVALLLPHFTSALAQANGGMEQGESNRMGK